MPRSEPKPPGGMPGGWRCAWCGGDASDKQGLLEHQAWCLRDPRANARLLSEVAAREGELTQEALVVAAARQRLAAEAKPGHD